MMLPLAAKLAALGGVGTALVMDNKAEREKIKKMVQEDEEKAKRASEDEIRRETRGKAKGGKVKKMAAGGSVSKRADGCAIRGKTKGRIM